MYCICICILIIDSAGDINKELYFAVIYFYVLKLQLSGI